MAPQGHTTIKAELDNSLPTSNIKAELDNSPPTPQNPSTPAAPKGHTNIKAELDNSLPTSNIKAEFDHSSLASQSSTSPVVPQRPNTTISIKAEIDMDSQPMEIETLYEPDMDTSGTSSDNETDSKLFLHMWSHVSTQSIVVEQHTREGNIANYFTFKSSKVRLDREVCGTQMYIWSWFIHLVFP